MEDTIRRFRQSKQTDSDYLALLMTAITQMGGNVPDTSELMNTIEMSREGTSSLYALEKDEFYLIKNSRIIAKTLPNIEYALERTNNE